MPPIFGRRDGHLSRLLTSLLKIGSSFGMCVLMDSSRPSGIYTCPWASAFAHSIINTLKWFPRFFCTTLLLRMHGREWQVTTPDHSTLVDHALTNLIKLIDFSLRPTPIAIARLFVIAQNLKQLWNIWNKRIFSNTHLCFNVHESASLVVETLIALISSLVPSRCSICLAHAIPWICLPNPSRQGV